MPRRVHLIGGVGLTDAAEAISTVGRKLGKYAPRIPDGETDRPWMGWLSHVLEGHRAFEVDDEQVPGRSTIGSHLRYRLKPGVDTSGLSFDGLRHAAVARASYDEFRRQKQRGAVPQTARFLFPIATPVGFCAGHLRPSDQAAVEDAYARALFAEIAKMTSAIPADELAIQWDAPVETWPIDRGTPTRFGSTRQEMIAAIVPRMVRIGEAVPRGVHLIYHFCYGNPGLKHIFEPTDMNVMVDLANGIAAGIERSVELYHMPVPVERDDDAYFAPLRRLDIAAESDLCLGLIHHDDGLAGAKRRMEVADRHIDASWRDYWIATECGMGRRDRAQVLDLLDLHAAAAAIQLVRV